MMSEEESLQDIAPLIQNLVDYLSKLKDPNEDLFKAIKGLDKKIELLIKTKFGELRISGNDFEEIFELINSEFPSILEKLETQIESSSLKDSQNNQLSGIVEETSQGTVVTVDVKQLSLYEGIGLLLVKLDDGGYPATKIYERLRESGFATTKNSIYARLAEMKSEGRIIKDNDEYRLSISGRKWVIEDVVKEFNRHIKVGCTGCRYCIPCPEDVGIPSIFGVWNDISRDVPVVKEMATTTSPKQIYQWMIDGTYWAKDALAMVLPSPVASQVTPILGDQNVQLYWLPSRNVIFPHSSVISTPGKSLSYSALAAAVATLSQAGLSVTASLVTGLSLGVCLSYLSPRSTLNRPKLIVSLK